MHTNRTDQNNKWPKHDVYEVPLNTGCPKKLHHHNTNCIYLLVMPKYWGGGNYFAHGRFSEVGEKQKTEKKKKEREKG